jgi:hypothetical protein
MPSHAAIRSVVPKSAHGDSGRYGPSARAVRRLATAASYRSEVTGVAVLLIARFSGDVAELTRAYDRAHAMIMAAGGAGAVRRTAASLRDQPGRVVYRRCLAVGGTRPDTLAEPRVRRAPGLRRIPVAQDRGRHHPGPSRHRTASVTPWPLKREPASAAPGAPADRQPQVRCAVYDCRPVMRHLPARSAKGG